jgi:hypothetical protein
MRAFLALGTLPRACDDDGVCAAGVPIGTYS